MNWLVRENFLDFVRLHLMCCYVSFIMLIPVILGTTVHVITLYRHCVFMLSPQRVGFDLVKEVLTVSVRGENTMMNGSPVSLEFLIKRSDGEWFNLHVNRFREVLRPRSFSSHPVPGFGDHRIEIRGCAISFSYEDPGILVCFENDNITPETAALIVDEIANSISNATGQKSEVIPR